MSLRPRILIALPTHALSTSLQQSLQQGLGSKAECLVCTDPYKIQDLLIELSPEVAIVSTNIISGVHLSTVKNHPQLTNTRFIAYCFNWLDENMTRNFDGKIYLGESLNTLTETINNLLYDPITQSIEDEEQALTPRERDIIIGVVKGLTNKEIALELNISTHTVITHRRNIAKKLQIHSPAGLTIYAIVNNLIELKDVK